MPTDTYTKAILTIIALCLIWICFRISEPVAFAQRDTAIRDRGGEVVKVQIVSIDEAPSLHWEAIPVIVSR